MNQFTIKGEGISGVKCSFKLSEVWALAHMRDRLNYLLETEDAHIFPVEDAKMLKNFLNRVLKGVPDVEPVDIFDPLPEEESKEEPIE